MICDNDKGINLFSLNDTMFLNCLVTESVLWENQAFRNTTVVTGLPENMLQIHTQSHSQVLLVSQYAHEGHIVMASSSSFSSYPKKHKTNSSPPASKVIA